jgi:putrescine aminotransferase
VEKLMTKQTDLPNVSRTLQNQHKLLRIDDCDKLDINTVWQYYRDYVNAAQVDLISSFGFGQELIVKAQGCTLKTQSGKEILDFTGGIGVLNHGHNHPRILAARKSFQEKHCMEVHKNYFSPYLAALSFNIAQLLPEDLNISYFPNSGAEAVEGALKMAYKYHQGQRHYILHSDISYHGKLLGAGSISASKELFFRFPEISGCRSFEYANIASIKQQIETLKQQNGQSDIYAIIIEPMSASSLRQCSESFLSQLRQLCTHHNIILIFDEVFTGWGKTGELFYFMHYNVVPDIVVSSKSLGGGKASIAAYIARQSVFKQAYGQLSDATLHSTTYNGFGEECLTAMEALNILIDDNYLLATKNIHQQIQKGLTVLQNEFPNIIKEVRGQGALQGILLASGPDFLHKITALLPMSLLHDDRFVQKLVTAAVINELYNRHQILTYYGENKEIILMAAPSLIVTESQINQFILALRQCFSQGLLKLTIKFIQSKLFNQFLSTIQSFKTTPLQKQDK